jgi:DNA repair protein RAD7
VPEDDEESDAYAPPTKRRRTRQASVDSDDLDALDDEEEGIPAVTANVGRGPKRAVGEFMGCGECSKQFTVVRT